MQLWATISHRTQFIFSTKLATIRDEKPLLYFA
jgi:hypothetical protein